MTDARRLRELFLLEPDVVFLNHGSFGACPRPVFEEYQRWQLELERRPVEFLGDRLAGLLDDVRAELGRYVGADPANLVLVPNATAGLNMVARSLALAPGDEILTTDREYGAIDLLWQFVAGKTGARIVRRALTAGAGLVDDLFAGTTDRTRVVSVSHVTSATALVLPVGDICRRARDAGILGVVDGAHGPGQVPLDLKLLGADVYAGNCHKWLCSPKGAAFLHVRPEHQPWIEPHVLSWDWGREEAFAARHRWQGTRDPAAHLAVPAAIAFQDEHGWPDVRSRCHALADQARRALAEVTRQPPLAPDETWLAQMVATPLPQDTDAEELKRRLREERRVEVAANDWNGIPTLRASFQGYNDEEDLGRLVAALDELL